MDTGRYAKLFLTESREYLVEINAALLELERGRSDAAVARLFRAVHTMKGMGAAMGYISVAELSHELETLLDKVRSGSIVTPAVIDALFAGVDALEQAVDLATAPTPQPLDAGDVISRIREAGDQLSQTFTAEFAIPKTEASQSSSLAQKRPQNVRIDSRRLDTLMNAVGELVIARDRIAQIAERLGDEGLIDATRQASQLVSNLQNEIMTSRMVPVWQVFERFPRVVRDTARTLGKEVEFKIEGKEIELDRSMLDEMGEPVLHLLRNSLDHGIELPADRVKAGKPRVATIILTAERDRATVLIRVTDDGRGIDQSRVLPRAKELGIVESATSKLS
ncbi:MAG TPA: Hpt domain-containing protein, partial [Gemmatimonadaceae bacterium]|nr:Hpt domain-containing protein [Gemmatimonadaceae bacterium]